MKEQKYQGEYTSEVYERAFPSMEKTWNKLRSYFKSRIWRNLYGPKKEAVGKLDNNFFSTFINGDSESSDQENKQRIWEYDEHGSNCMFTSDPVRDKLWNLKSLTKRTAFVPGGMWNGVAAWCPAREYFIELQERITRRQMTEQEYNYLLNNSQESILIKLEIEHPELFGKKTKIKY